MNEKRRKIHLSKSLSSFCFWPPHSAWRCGYGMMFVRSAREGVGWVFYMAGNKLDFSKNEHTRNSFVFGVKYGPRHPSVCRAAKATTHLGKVEKERRNLIWFSLYFPLLCVGRRYNCALRGGPSKEHIPKKRCFPRLGFPATSCVLDVNTMYTRTAAILVDQLPLAAWSELWTVTNFGGDPAGITHISSWAKTERPKTGPSERDSYLSGAPWPYKSWEN